MPNYNNPEPAMEALCGKTYEFKGRKFRNSNAAMIAVIRSGIPWEEAQKRIVEAAPVGVWGMLEDIDKVSDALGDPALIRKLAFEFCAQFTDDEMAKLSAIFVNAFVRYIDSMTRYAVPDKNGNPDTSGNGQAPAGMS